ncbi:amino acid permease [Candidatus Bathyarchaeota archaeon]|nr:amino acid permease [Candidatus Bathyarchaeota archaeon]
MNRFYILGLFFVGLLVPHDDDNLFSATGGNDPNTSPFVLAAKYAGLHGLDHFITLVILVSVLSIGMSAVFGGSRCLTALAQQGYAPEIFTYIDRSGRPLPSVIIHLVFGLLSLMSINDRGAEVFQWLLAISALGTLFTWGSICLAHIRFRSAWKQQGHSLDEIPFKAIGGIAGTWLGFILCILVFAATVSLAMFQFPLCYWPLTRGILVLHCHSASRAQAFFYELARRAYRHSLLDHWILMEADWLDSP